MGSPCGDDEVDEERPRQSGGTRPLDHPPPPGSSLVFAARTWNFEKARRVAADDVAVADDGPPPAAGIADVARSRSTNVAEGVREECCDAEGGTGRDGAHWRASPQT